MNNNETQNERPTEPLTQVSGYVPRHYGYSGAKCTVSVTGMTLFSQLLLVEGSGILQRKADFWWVLPVVGTSFAASVVYAAALLVLNAHEARKVHNTVKLSPSQQR